MARIKTGHRVLIGSLIIGVLLLFTARKLHQANRQGCKLIQTHAQVIANDIWQFDSTGAQAYLQLAARLDHYQSLKVIVINNDCFTQVTGPELSDSDRLCLQLGLIPLRTFRAPIIHQQQKIGTLIGRQYLLVVYPILNFLVFILLLLFVGLFLFNLFTSRKRLLHEVKVRTNRYRESERRFQALVTMLPEMVWEADTEGNLTYVNQIAYERFGYDHNLLNKRKITILDFLLPDDRARAQENFRQALQGGKQGFNEYQVRTREGKIIPILVRTAPIFEQERLIGARGIIIDITEIRNLEQQLLQAQKMEAIGTLAGGIAHDFNNILAAIMGHIELLQIETRNSPAVSARLQRILQAAHRARNLIQQILTFSRRGEQVRQPVQLKQIILEVADLIRSSLPATVEVRLKLDSDARVLADSSQIHQMIMNLCTNAYQAMGSAGGILGLELRDTTLPDPAKIPTGEEQTRQYIELNVSDTGCGISGDHLERIFDPYFTTKESGSGSGLGLAVVYGIIREHDGFIKVESHPNRGTTFRVYLPIASPQHQPSAAGKPDPAPEPTSPNFQAQKKKIMLIDDEPQLLEILRTYLEQLGYEIETFDHPEKASSRFREGGEEFSLVITDQSMPKILGTTLSREFKQLRPNCPIILCSGYRAELGELDLEAAGIDTFLSKPIELQKVAETIARLL